MTAHDADCLSRDGGRYCDCQGLVRPVDSGRETPRSNTSEGYVMEQTEQDRRYEAAKTDEVAALILDALHEQDARTYNGNSSDIGTLALQTAQKVEDVVRRSERQRLADLFDDHRASIGSFPTTPEKAIELVSVLLRLDHP